MASPELWAPWVSIATPKVLLPFYIKELVVHSEEGMHQWAQLTVRYYLSSGMRTALGSLPPSLWWAEDKPVRITYGPRRAISKEFVGYVVSPELISDATDPAPHVEGQMLDVRYTLLGATKPLQTTRARTWSTCQAQYIVRELASANGLNALVGKHPRVFEQRQQAESDFHFMQRIADEVGWRLVADGSTIYFTDPRTPLTSQTPLFRQNATAGLQDTMQAFRAVSGELDPAGAIRAQHEALSLSSAGVISTARTTATRTDAATGREIAAQVRRRAADHVAGSYAEAQAITTAAATRSLWWVSATATVDGDVSLMPGTVVRLGGSALTSQYAGKWMTRSAHHRITLNQADRRLSSYYVDLQLGRDQPDRLTVDKVPFMPLRRNVLANARWTSRVVA
ncbi:hypothetical protein ACFYP4_02655 [Streptomyces sp. NPDC005551]|uniref:hypothetical protein n=1 Tax=Streptomyces sp. NPDC005551 TaxID=3364725 RepID=UPI0036C3133A